jgi:hypothetical protein
MLHSPRRKPRHAPGNWRLLLICLTWIMRPARTNAAFDFMFAADHQRVILHMLEHMPPGMKLQLFPGGFIVSQETRDDEK